MKEAIYDSKDEDQSLKLFIVLNRAIEAIREQVIKDVKRYGLNLTEFAVMELLYHKGRQPIQMIGKKVLLASSSITYVVDKLEKKELLMRISCPKDRRVTYAQLTGAGEKLIDEAFPQHRQAMAEIFSALSEEEKDVAIGLLKKLGLHAQSLP